MRELTIRIKKKTDGGAALSCTRADGSVTWQRQDGRLGEFFPLHDLTHYAVETVLGFKQAFYGLVAAGWDIASFELPGTAARLPDEAKIGELIVGFFDVERATGEGGNAADFKWKIDTYFDEHGQPAPPFSISDEQLTAIRERRARLFEKWRALPAGETLELRFE